MICLGYGLEQGMDLVEPKRVEKLLFSGSCQPLSGKFYNERSCVYGEREILII